MSEDQPGLVVVGAILGAHGVRGDVRVRSFAAEPEACFTYGPLLNEAGEVLLEADAVRPAKTHFIVRPREPKQKEAWDALKGARLHVPRDRLGPLEEDEFFIDDLVGLTVFAGGDTAVGTVSAVHNFGAGDLIEIDPADGGKSVLVPFTREDVPQVDLKARRLVVATLDLWAEKNQSSDDV